MRFQKHFLILSLALVSLYVCSRWNVRQQFADGCDSFGYLRLGQVLRDWSGGDPLEYKIVNEQNQRLIKTLQLSEFEPGDWSHFVAPHAHHYNSKIEKVGIQYPPGTGLMLWPFNPNRSIQDLCIFVSIVLAFLGGLIILARSSSGRNVLPIVFACFSAILLVDTVKHYSYSIQASILFLALGSLALSYTYKEKYRSRAAVFSGILFALACLCRIPILFHTPGWFFLAHKKSRINFTLVFNLTFWPILFLYNFHVTGSPFTFTYSGIDKTVPSLANLRETIPYYLWGGGTQFLWAVLIQILLVWKRVHITNNIKIGLALLIGVPFLYFLTHPIYWSYYMHPTWLALVWALGAFAWLVPNGAGILKKRDCYVMGAMTLASIVLMGLVIFRGPQVKEPSRNFDVSENVQTLIHRPDVWVLSDILSGSFWYYHKTTAYRPNFSKNGVDLWFVDWVLENQEHLLVVNDSSSMKAFLETVKNRGYLTSSVGHAFGKPVFELKK